MFRVDKIEKSFLARVEVQGTSRMRLEIAEAEAAKARADGAVTTEAEEAAADTLNLVTGLVSDPAKAERTIACEEKEVAASPSASCGTCTLLVVVEAEAVEKADDEDLLLLLLAPQTTALSAIAGSEIYKSPPSTALIVLLEAPAGRCFLRILTGFDGMLIKCLGSGEGTRTSA
jgi:hypothetical protein